MLLLLSLSSVQGGDRGAGKSNHVMLRGHAYCLLVARSSGFCTPQRSNASDT